MRRVISGLSAFLVMAMIIAFTAVPALAQQRGLVNVDVDVTDNVLIVQVPIGVAANICGVDANILAQQRGQQDVACEANADSTADAIAQLPPAFQP